MKWRVVVFSLYRYRFRLIDQNKLKNNSKKFEFILLKTRWNRLWLSLIYGYQKNQALVRNPFFRSFDHKNDTASFEITLDNC
jgi:hypothetical protein